MRATQFRHEALIYRGESRINALEEYFYCDDELHREDGPAVIKYNYAFDTAEESYYLHGKRHRKNGPAVIVRNSDGSTVEEYHRNGKLDRTDGPAIVIRNSDGSTVEEYYRNGGLHRKNGPQIVKRYADGSTEENYCDDGQDRLHHDRLHRFDGPASIVRNADGSLKEERYYYGGIPRDIEFGPAVIKHNADGTTVREYYRHCTSVKTEYLNSEGVVVKTEGLASGELTDYAKAFLGADKGLTGQSVAVQDGTPAPLRIVPPLPADIPIMPGESGRRSMSAQRKPRLPGMAS